MRVAIFSDLHGNPYACEVVLDAIAAAGEMDMVLAAGDLCLGGSDPAACVALMQDAEVQGVYGNTEIYVAEPDRVPPDELHRRKWDMIEPVARWVREQLTDAQLGWLEGLPFARRVSPSGQKKLWGQARQPDDDPDLVAALEDTQAAVVAFGHFHTMFQRPWRGLNLVNVACCSMPGIDHDPRARYSVFEWVGGRWHVDQHWVSYDETLEIEALKQGDMPCKETYLRYWGV